MIIAGFDLETTGFDGSKDHIVQYSFQVWNDGERMLNETRIVNPGVPILNSEIHGITDEIAANGISRENALSNIGSMLAACRDGGIPVAIMNARFDLTFYRDVIQSVYEHSVIPDVFVVDPMVIDKRLERFRKGPRKLADLAGYYGEIVDSERLHEAGYDVELTVRLARKLMGVVGTPVKFLYECQKQWYDDQAKSLYEYFKRNGNEAYKEISYGWPVAGRLIDES